MPLLRGKVPTDTVHFTLEEGTSPYNRSDNTQPSKNISNAKNQEIKKSND
jgi:hypothetical protein